MPPSGPTAVQLAATFDRQTLRRLAGTRAFARGEDYFAGGRVHSLDEHASAVVSQVSGSEPYAVRLWADGKELAYSCACPRGNDGEFCKHCVAVGLAVLAGRTKPTKQKAPKPKLTLEHVRQYLIREDKSALVDLLMERALWDDTLRDQLFLRVATGRGNGSGVDVGAMREALDRAIRPREFVSWDGAGSYASGVEEAVQVIEGVLKAGHAAEAIDLSEHALAAVEGAMEFVDDSGGHMGPILERLQELHLQACKTARPDPVELARRLFAREISSGYDAFSGSLVAYAPALGESGAAEYRRLARERWQTVATLGPGQDEPGKYGARRRIASIMMAIAQMDGDLEAQVAVHERDLSHAYAFLKIAELYSAAGERDLALEWAEKGMRAFAGRPDSRLREFVAAEYHRRTRHDDAMSLAWSEFSERPTLAAYQDLKRHAEIAEVWPSWREKALNTIRSHFARRKRDSGKSVWGATGADHSLLVEIHLWERDFESAWTEAQSGGCSRLLWMALARKREKQHPRDALPIYQREVEQTLAYGAKDAYVTAVQLLKRIRDLMVRLGAERDFVEYLESVRSTHARKRNFMRLLMRAQWS